MRKQKNATLYHAVDTILSDLFVFFVVFLSVATVGIALLFSVPPQFVTKGAIQESLSDASAVYVLDRKQLDALVLSNTVVEPRHLAQDVQIPLFYHFVSAINNNRLWWSTFKAHRLAALVCNADVDYDCFETNIISKMKRNFEPDFPASIDLELVTIYPEEAPDFLNDVIGTSLKKAALEAEESLKNTAIAFKVSPSRTFGSNNFTYNEIADVTIAPFTRNSALFPKLLSGIIAILLTSMLTACTFVWFKAGWRTYKQT